MTVPSRVWERFDRGRVVVVLRGGVPRPTVPRAVRWRCRARHRRSVGLEDIPKRGGDCEGAPDYIVAKEGRIIRKLPSIILVHVVDPILQILLWEYCNVLVSVFIFIKLIRFKRSKCVMQSVASAWPR